MLVTAFAGEVIVSLKAVAYLVLIMVTYCYADFDNKSLTFSFAPFTFITSLYYTKTLVFLLSLPFSLFPPSEEGGAFL